MVTIKVIGIIAVLLLGGFATLIGIATLNAIKPGEETEQKKENPD